ncbi:MAG TPA: hypothetical protein VM100_09545 [Longimicrobiales bacterium]|nr:hypothetical protein [Longimicrobiales bacterium]
MTRFEHFSVLISIVIGLGVTQLLLNVYQLIQARERLRAYWLPIFWTCVLFVAMVEWWWYLWDIRAHTEGWNFFYFMFVLMSPVTLYMAAAFALPEPRDNEVTDLREYYYRNHAYFFAMVAAGPALDSIRRGIESGSFTDLGAVTNAISAVLVGSLAFTRNARYHVLISLIVTALFSYFILAAALHLN